MASVLAGHNDSELVICIYEVGRVGRNNFTNVILQIKQYISQINFAETEFHCSTTSPPFDIEGNMWRAKPQTESYTLIYVYMETCWRRHVNVYFHMYAHPS